MLTRAPGRQYEQVTLLPDAERRPRRFTLIGRTAYQKYFLPNVWETNLARLGVSDPDLFVEIDW